MKKTSPDFIDLKTIQGLLPRFGKRQFETLVDQEMLVNIAKLSNEERAFFAQKIIQNADFLGQATEKNSEEIVQIEQEMTVILAKMERIGVAFDREKMEKIGEELRREVAALEAEIFSIIGEKINLNSPKQLQVLFFQTLGIKPIKKNKTGFSVDTDVLEEIAKTHDVARLILEYRSLSKLLSTYVDGLLKTINPVTGRIHTTYDSLGTVTGRMSSNDPNLQNIPTSDGYGREIKSCFVPSAGNVLVVADYSQIELRILAFLSQDKNLLEAFIRGDDIHDQTARFLFGEKNITPSERRIAKSVNFGVIYGITGFGLAKTLNCSPWEAQKYVETFYQTYPNVKKFYEKLLKMGREQGYVETFFGRRRYLPGLNDANKTMKNIAEREAMNMPIQGTAADILKFAMKEIEHRIAKNNWQGKMILQVHDELVFDVPEGEKEDFMQMIKTVMENIFRDYAKNISQENMIMVPLVVDIHSGENWAEAK